MYGFHTTSIELNGVYSGKPKLTTSEDCMRSYALDGQISTHAQSQADACHMHIT